MAELSNCSAAMRAGAGCTLYDVNRQGLLTLLIDDAAVASLVVNPGTDSLLNVILPTMVSTLP